MWQPFSEPARRAVVRAQEVAVMFGSTFIGNEHIAFALAEGDDDIGHLLANALDRDAIRERLGGVSSEPVPEMSFSTGAKRSIERAFEHARRLNHDYIGPAHIALGMLDSGDPPPLLHGSDDSRLRERLDVLAAMDDPSRTKWKQVGGADDHHAVAGAVLSAVEHYKDLRKPGTRVSVTITPVDGDAHTWAWEHVDEKKKG